jgi:hypothetical protein
MLTRAFVVAVVAIIEAKQPQGEQGLLVGHHAKANATVEVAKEIDQREKTLVQVGEAIGRREELVSVEKRKENRFEDEISQLEGEVHKLEGDTVGLVANNPYLGDDPVVTDAPKEAAAKAETVKPETVEPKTAQSADVATPPPVIVADGIDVEDVKTRAQMHAYRALRTITSFILGGFLGRIIPGVGFCGKSQSVNGVSLESLKEEWPPELLSV